MGSFLKVMVGAVVVGCLAMGDVAAGVLLYTDGTSFDAASTTSVLSDFEGLTTSSSYQNPWVVDGVNYQETNGLGATVCAANTCGGNPFDSAIMVSSYAAPLEIDVGGIGFDVTAVGGIFGNILTGPSNATIDVYGAGDALLASFAIQVLDLGAGLEHSFFGFAATEGDVITRLVFDLSGSYSGYEGVDNMQFGAAVSTTPLPAALPLFLTMLAGIGGLRWWRRKVV